jgi:dihydrofolate reductase
VIVYGMRKLVVTQNITLDGVIDAAGGWFSPGDDSGELAEVTSVLQEQATAADAVLLGRVSFEEMRSFWPHQTDDTPPASPSTSTKYGNMSFRRR